MGVKVCELLHSYFSACLTHTFLHNSSERFFTFRPIPSTNKWPIPPAQLQLTYAEWKLIIIQSDYRDLPDWTNAIHKLATRSNLFS